MAPCLHRSSVQFHLVEADLGGGFLQRCILQFGFHTRNRILMTFSITIHGTNVPFSHVPREVYLIQPNRLGRL